tara:strand:+ start:212 stop:397 length:186 start_codon:yes stop_codon:yes gene_type:complete
MKTFKITYEDSAEINIPADIENPSIEYIMSEFRRHVLDVGDIVKIVDADGEIVFEHKEYTQ